MKKNKNLIIDSNQRPFFNHSFYLSDPVIEILNQNQTEKKVFFLATAQKGTSSSYICSDCNYIPRCRRCDKFYYVTKDNRLKCPICEIKKPIIKKCPKCQSSIIKYMGLGEKKLLSELLRLKNNRLIPDYPLLEFNETLKAKTKENLIEKIINLKQGFIIGGSQVLNLAFFNPNTYAILHLNSDKNLFYPDFNVGENKFEEIASINSDHYLTVMQTKFFENNFINLALNNNYQKFYQTELKSRKENNLPPFVKLIKFNFKAKDQKEALKVLTKLNRKIKKLKSLLKLHLDPYPGYPEKIRGYYIYKLTIGFKEKDRLKLYKNKDFQEIIVFCNKNKINLDVDPVGIV
jgi:primosomal protein N' (replication factor Y)